MIYGYILIAVTRTPRREERVIFTPVKSERNMGCVESILDPIKICARFRCIYRVHFQGPARHVAIYQVSDFLLLLKALILVRIIDALLVVELVRFQ